MSGYIDLHNHSIFGVDDGAETLADSVAMLSGLYAAGYRHVTCTPHVRSGYWENHRSDLEPRLEDMRQALGPAGLEDLGLSLGAENFLDPWFLDRMEGGELIPLGEGKHVLVELPHSGLPTELENMLFRLQVSGYKPLLAHPERYDDLMGDLKRMRSLQERGTKLQISVTSLGGKFGWRIKRMAKRLLKEGLCDLLATDVHSPRGVKEYIEPGLGLARKMVGETEAQRLLCEIPSKVLWG